MATLAGRFALRSHHAPPAITTKQRRERGGERREPETPLLRSRRCGRHGFGRFRGLRLCGDADLQRISANLPVDVLELGRTEIGDLHLEPAAHLPIGVLRKTNCARRRNALKPRGDIDAVAHQVAVALLDDVADVNPDAEFDSSVLGHAGVALDEAVLNLDRAAHRVDDAAELDDRAVAGALDDAAVMGGDGWIDEVAAEPPQARKGPILVGAGEPAITNDIRNQDRRELSGLAHCAPPAVGRLAQMPVPVCLFRRKDRSCAHSFRTEHQAGRSPSGRLDPFAAPFGYDRYLRI